MNNQPAPEVAIGDHNVAPYRRVLTWLLHYVFWVFVLSCVVAFVWLSASGSSAFRYAGF